MTIEELKAYRANVEVYGKWTVWSGNENKGT